MKISNELNEFFKLIQEQAAKEAEEYFERNKIFLDAIKKDDVPKLQTNLKDHASLNGVANRWLLSKAKQ
jgi:hypothetical protein